MEPKLKVPEARFERPVRVRLPGGPFIARDASGPSGPAAGWIEVFDPKSKSFSWDPSSRITFGDLMEGESLSDAELAELGIASEAAPA